MNMANYILRILKSRIFIILSWGFNSPIRLQNGLKFKVQGYIHSGWVEVLYNEGNDLFDVSILNLDGTVKRKETNVYLDCLVDVIDGMVERTADYQDRVKEEYGMWFYETVYEVQRQKENATKITCRNRRMLHILR